MNSGITQIGPYQGTYAADGGFATVYRIPPEANSSSPIALKWANAPIDPATLASLQNEYAVLGELDHPQLPAVHDFGWQDHRPFIAMDWVDGPELWDLPMDSPEERFRETLRQIARVLCFIHHRGWVHGDLKPDNFLWATGTPGRRDTRKQAVPRLCLLDFGLARTVGDTGRPRGAGTMGYTAPEFLQKQPADGRADWYSVGIILYEWVFGERPFAAADPAVEVSAHLEQAPNLERPRVQPVPEWGLELIQRLLAKNPDERASDEYQLLSFMSGHDPALDPNDILNAQMDYHRRSENRRAIHLDQNLLDQVVSTVESGTVVDYTVAADPISGFQFARTIHTMGVTRAPETRGVWPVCVGQLDHESLRQHVGVPRGGLLKERGFAAPDSPHQSTILLHPWSVPAVNPRSAEGETLTSRLSLRPWDTEGVRAYLRNLTGSDEFSNRWSATVYAITDGIPTAVSNLAATLIERGDLRCDDGEWDIAPNSLKTWQDRSEGAAAYALLVGDLSADERRVCDWVSLGRSLARYDILKELWTFEEDRLSTAFRQLCDRGIVIPSDGPFLNWRFRLTGLADLWRAQLPATQRRRQALQLGATIECCAPPDDLATQEVMAACFADAGSWDKSVHFSVSVADTYLKLKRHDDAESFILLAEAAAERIPDGRTAAYWRGRARMARGRQQRACGQLDDAQKTYRELLVLGRKHGDRRLLAEALNDLGMIYKTTRRFEKGVRSLKRARQIWEDIGDSDEVAHTTINLGNMYWVASDRTEARRHYTEALERARALGNDQRIAVLLSNIGATYWGDHDFGRAESYYRESLELWKQVDDPVETAGTLNNLGVLAFDQGQLQEADRYLRSAIEINNDAGAESEALFGRGNLIQVILEHGDLRLVIDEATAAIRDADALGDVATGAEVRGLLAEAYLRAGDFRTASSYLSEARERAAGQKNDNLDAQLELVAAMWYQRLGQSSQALALLDDIDSLLLRAEMPRLKLDAMIIRLRDAVETADAGGIDHWWDEGMKVAEQLSARHKMAQLSFARLPNDPGNGYPAEARIMAEEFLRSNCELHWASGFRLWTARHLALSGDLAAAEEMALTVADSLRREGNWDMLWRAMALYGGLCYQRADYEPALGAFNEAVSVLDEILKTIDHESGRQVYATDPQAERLLELKSRILQLT